MEKEKKLMELGSRKFFLCPRKCSSDCVEGGAGNGGSATTSFSSCSKEVGKVTKNNAFAWFNLKLMDFNFML